MTIIQLLNLSAFASLGFCALGLGFKAIPFLKVREPRRPSLSAGAIDGPVNKSFSDAALLFLLGPARHFHRRSNPLWVFGYACYHLAILMVITGYAMAALMLAAKLATGKPILNLVTHQLAGGNVSPANLLGLTFGNAEPGPSAFLFGSFSPWFRGFAWAELPLALIGNLCLLATVLRRSMGAVHGDLDPAVRDLRLSGTFSGQHLLVRSIIFAIIVMEFIGRNGWIPDIAYYHALLGMGLIALFPVTYLAHIPLAPLAVWLGVRRRRLNLIA